MAASLQIERGTGRASESPGKIKVTCHSCGARYLVPESKVRGRRFRATCKRCGGIIVARFDQASFTVLPERDGGARQEPRGSKKRSSEAVRLRDADLDEPRRAVDEAEWFVAVDGEPHGPLGVKELREWLQLGRIDQHCFVWREGQDDWLRLSEQTELAEVLAEEQPTRFFDDPELGERQRAWQQQEEQERRGERAPHDQPFAAGGGDDFDDGFLDRPGQPPAEMEGEPTRLRRADQLFELPPKRAEPSVRVRLERSWSREIDLKSFGVQPGKVDSLERRGDAGRYGAPEAEPRTFDSNVAKIRGGMSLWSVPQRREAVLPAPTGQPKRAPTVGTAVPAPAAPAVKPSDHTRPLSDHERQNLFETAYVAPPPAGPNPSPAGPVASGGGGPAAPPPLPVKSGLLPDLAPPLPPLAVPSTAPPLQAPNLLKPKRESFWTPGRIVLATVVGSALVICIAVTIVAGVLKSRQSAPVAVAQQQAAPAAAKTQAAQPPAPAHKAAAPERKPAPEAEPAVQITFSGEQSPSAHRRSDRGEKGSSAPVQEDDEGKDDAPPAKATGAAQPRDDAPVAKAATGQPKKRRPHRRTASRHHRRASHVKVYEPKPRKTRRKRSARKRSGGDEIDDLLAAATPPSRRKRKPKASPSVAADVDDILSAGGGKRSHRRAKSRGGGGGAAADADDILAAAGGSGGGSGRSSRPSRSQIRRTMSRLKPRVQACFDKHRVPGMIKLSVRIRSDGRCTGHATGRFANTPTAACIERGLPGLRFPTFSGKPVVVRYPFVLKGR